MDRDLDQHQQQTHLQQKHQPMNSSLTRYQSAPSSYFANLADSDSRDVGYGGGKYLDQLLNSRALSPETQRIFRRFMFNTSGADDPSSYNQPQIARNASGIQKAQSQFETQMKNTGDVLHHQNEQQQLLMEQRQRHQQNSDFSTASQMIYRGHSQPNQNIFCSINVKDGRMRNQMEYSSGLPPSSSSGLVSQISESGRKSMGMGASKDANFAEGHRTLGEYITGFSVSSWDDDSTTMSDKLLKGFRDNDQKSFSNPKTSENQRSESGNRPPTLLSHHLSLPKSSELSSMEKFLQFQDMVPCQMRAKRGFATHPRSIAERVRKTRISERMRKLQELVPNMDKQTNTSDMLDLAVDYIKDLQNQVKVLSENRAKCKCSNKHKP